MRGEGTVEVRKVIHFFESLLEDSVICSDAERHDFPTSLDRANRRLACAGLACAYGYRAQGHRNAAPLNPQRFSERTLLPNRRSHTMSVTAKFASLSMW